VDRAVHGEKGLALGHADEHEWGERKDRSRQLGSDG
jgi:hypothetical protein